MPSPNQRLKGKNIWKVNIIESVRPTKGLQSLHQAIGREYMAPPLDR